MADLPTVVVTGYGAWAMTEANPSAQILTGLTARAWDDCHLVTLEVPVVSDELYDRVEQTLLTHRPRVWMSIGVAPGSPAIRAEMVGTNWRYFDVPDNSGTDNSGASLSGRPVVEQGPAAYNADFPNHEIVAALKAAGIPAMVSYSAGTHLCNQMLYTASHLIERHGLQTRCGFLHVPLTPDHVARQSSPHEIQASMGLAMMTEAAAIALNQAIMEMKAAA